MPQFAPGVTKTAKVLMTNPTAKPFDYNGVLYMGTNLAVMAEVPFHLEAGGQKDISFPVTMPTAAGTYPVHIGVFSGGQSIGLYKATEDVVIMPVGTNLYGKVTDSVTGLPIAGAEVRVLAGTLIKAGITQADGTYLVSDLTPGDTIWACLKNGYVVITDTPITLVEGNNELNIKLVPIGPMTIDKLEVRLVSGGYIESKITVSNNLGRSIPAYDPYYGAATRLSGAGVVPSLEQPGPFGPIPFIFYLTAYSWCYAVEIPMGTKVFQGTGESPTTAPDGSYCKAFIAIDGVYRYAARGFEGYLRSTWQTWQPDGLAEFPTVPGPEIPVVIPP